MVINGDELYEIAKRSVNEFNIMVVLQQQGAARKNSDIFSHLLRLLLHVCCWVQMGDYLQNFIDMLTLSKPNNR